MTTAGMPDNQRYEEYEAPRVQTFSQEEFLAVLGPAQGYGGDGVGPGAPAGIIERPRRFFVGMR